jgi:sugar lactone lactonase YvrE
MTRVLLALAAVAAVVASVAGAQSAFPSRIELPDSFRPEGIAIAGNEFFVGSIPTGTVYHGDLRTGEGTALVVHTDRMATGMKVDRGRLFVAGAGTGRGWVYDTSSGATIAAYSFAAPPTFINDVVVTRDAAWFTDSQQAVLYRVPLGPAGGPAPTFETLDLVGDFVQQPGFNVNGIAATSNGKTLVIVQSNTGKLFTVTPSVTTADTHEIDLTDELGGGESVPMGDGILLDGKTLYVVQNRANMIAKIQLAPDLGSGTVVTRITNADFDVPTTIAEHGSRLYAVNARFEPPPRPTPDYWITQVGK